MKNVTPASAGTICEKLAAEIRDEEAHLLRLNNDADRILSSSDDIDYKTLNTINETIDRRNQIIVDLKSRQRKNGCLDDKKLLVAFDNQSIISTSMVRRKTAADVAPTPLSVDFGGKNTVSKEISSAK